MRLEAMLEGRRVLRSMDPSAMATRILVVTREGKATVHALADGAVVTVGRDMPCEVRIPDLSVSRKHALVHVGNKIEVEDLGSQNRTRVRGVPVPRNARVELKVGETVEFGRAPATLQLAVPSAGMTGGQVASRPTEPLGGDEVVVLDATMRELHRTLDQVAAADISVLLLGETGVGKDVLAEAIHRRSPRRDKAFLRLNCATLTEHLLESELFGHERGAFTGASAAKPGLLEFAADGTAFLDEVGELPLSLQAKLLHALETRQVRRVGGTTTRTLGCRFVAATNRDLEADVGKGTFRADLYYRLSGVSLRVPPLRERTTEIEPLARRFVSESCMRQNRSPVLHIEAEALEILKGYSWPGNIRELRNVIERAVALCPGQNIGTQHLAQLVNKTAAAPVGQLRDAVDAVERQRVLDVLRRCHGNQSQAARELGIARNTLAARLRRWGVDPTQA
jgi:two-component system response regulator AtoC